MFHLYSRLSHFKFLGFLEEGYIRFELFDLILLFFVIYFFVCLFVYLIELAYDLVISPVYSISESPEFELCLIMRGVSKHVIS